MDSRRSASTSIEKSTSSPLSHLALPPTTGSSSNMDDPFPKSFTAVSSPRYFNEFLDENDDTEFSILHRNMINAPDPTYDDDLNNSFASYSSPAPRVSDQNQDMASKSLDDPSRWTTSPESSTSSDSSNQHHRTDSTNSSGTENINSNYAPTAAHGIVIGTDAADHDSMNKLMEAQFDFDSAASSPEGLSIGQMTDSKTSNGMKMPFRPGSLRPMGGFNSDPVGINVSRSHVNPEYFRINLLCSKHLYAIC